MEALPMTDTLFIGRLVEKGLITSDDLKERMQNQKTSREKSGLFLDEVILRSVDVGDLTHLINLLRIMSNETDYKNALLKKLADDIKLKLSEGDAEGESG